MKFLDFRLLSILVLFTCLNGHFIAQPLSGTYTIGGLLPNYQNITDAVSDLNTEGVSGPVTFNIRSGTYTERVSVVNVTGASASNPIIFQSENQDSSSVVWKYSSGGYVFKAFGTPYITLQHLTLEAVNFNQDKVVDIDQNCHYFSLRNCHMKQSAIDTENSSHIHIIQNNFDRSIFNFTVIDAEGYNQKGIYIDSNQFSSSRDISVQVSNFDSVLIRNNQGNARLNLFSSYGNLEISGNDFRKSSSLQINTTFNNLNQEILVFNNLFVDSSFNSPIRFRKSRRVKFYNNTVMVKHQTTGRVINLDFDADSTKIFNNILTNISGGPIFHFYSGDGLIEANHNCYYNVDNEFASYRTSPSKSYNEWHSQTPHDSNSMFWYPVFKDDGSFRIDNDGFINNQGTPALAAPIDIDLDSRNPITPDIGVDEFDLNYSTLRDLEVIAPLHPHIDSCALDSQFVLRFVNHSSFTIDSFRVNLKINNITYFSQTLNIPIASMDTLIYKVFDFNFRYNTEYPFEVHIDAVNGELDNIPQNNTYNHRYLVLDSPDIRTMEINECSSDVQLSTTRFQDLNYLWSDGSTSHKTIVSSGIHTCTMTLPNGCTSNSTKTIQP